MEQRRLGLALGGGGGKGSAHLGVLHELERLNVKIDMISGTSIGSIAGGFWAAGFTANQIADHFRSTTARRILGLDPARWGLLGSEKLSEVLYSVLGDLQIEDLPTPYAAVAVDLVTGHEVTLDHGSLVEAMLASSAVPGVFPPLRVGDYILADGGARNNLPTDVARRLGADRVIAVNLIGEYDAFSVSDPHELSVFSLRRWVPLTQLALAERAISIMLHQLTLYRLREDPPDLLISPDIHAISMADLNQLDDGIGAGIIAVQPYVDELDVLRRWRLGEDLSLHG